MKQVLTVVAVMLLLAMPCRAAGEPEQVEIPCGTPAELADLLWDSLNAENKVSLFVRYIDRKTGDWETVIKNTHASA